MNKIKITRENYDSLSSKDANTLYLIKKEGKLYKGSTQYWNTFVDASEIATSMVLTTPPLLEYESGQVLNLTNMVLTATYLDGHSAVVTSGITTSPAMGVPLTTLDTTLTISYQGLTVTQVLDVYAAPDYLCFTANTAGSQLGLRYCRNSWTNISISTDKITWTPYTWDASYNTPIITLANIGDKVYFRGVNNCVGHPDVLDNGMFYMNGSISASGNINTLLNYKLAITDLSTLGNCTFTELFCGCSSLTSAPYLPATTLSMACYLCMFYGCTSLAITPELPATTLAYSCYASMFKGCTSLTKCSALPALSAPFIPAYAYTSMYANCTSLTYVPALPALGYDSYALECMFYGCTSLYVSESEVSGTAEYEWNIPTTGGFSVLTLMYNIFGMCPGDRPINGDSLVYESQLPETKQFNFYVANKPIKHVDYFCLTALEPNSSVRLKANTWTYLETSRNGSTWTEYTANTIITLPNIGDKIYWRGTNQTISSMYSYYGASCFFMKGKLSASGNINTLLALDGDVPDLTGRTYCFTGLFMGCDALTSVENLQLPATTLVNCCYNYLFYNCTNITAAPALPAITLASLCYRGMFRGCSSLITAPTLSAITLADACYDLMFYNCTALVTPPALPALTATYYCYGSMFEGCTSLTTAPSLPATTLATSCYNCMFQGCTSLYVSDDSISGVATNAWVIPTNAIASGDYTMTNMFTSCLGTRSGGDSPNFNGVQKTYYTQNTPVS